MFELIIKFRVLLLGLIYNKTSERYFVKYKKLIQKSFFYEKDYNYLLAINMKEKLADVVNNKIKHERSPAHFTEEIIQFGQVAFGSILKQFKKSHAKPDVVVYERFEDTVFVIFTYREQLLGRKVRRNFVFCNGEFFLGEIIIPQDPANQKHYDKLTLSDGQIKLGVVSDLFKSFHVDMPPDLVDFFTISDNDSGRIQFLDNGFTYQIKYFSKKNQKLYDLLLRLYHNSQEIDQAKKVIISSFMSGEVPVTDHSYAY